MTALVEIELHKSRPGKRVLSIQSHVVSGYAGNKCAVFPLQLHGFEVDVINSVQFSNHTGHKGGVRGTQMNLEDLRSLIEGLEANNLLEYSHVLTGYCADVSFLSGIVELVTKLKKRNPQLIYVCDPVLGDNGYYYTAKGLMDVYRDEVLPLADVLTPNAFELGEITGMPCNTEEQCLQAVSKIQTKYKIKHVVVTSGTEDKQDKVLTCLGSSCIDDVIKQYRFEVPRIQGNYVGTGDVFACLLLVWMNETNNDIKTSIQNVLLSLQSLLKRTAEKAYNSGMFEIKVLSLLCLGSSINESKQPTFKERELCLIDSRYDLLIPRGDIKCTHL